MASRVKQESEGGGAQSLNMFLAPAFALGMWNPFLAGALRGSAQASEEFVRSPASGKSSSVADSRRTSV
jgi:hypothetical protein